MIVIEKLLKSFIRKGLEILTKLTKRKISDHWVETIYEFFKFGIVGLSNTLLSYMIYLVSWSGIKWLGISGEFRYLSAQTIAFIVGVLWSFYWNNKLVFTESREERHIWKALLKTFASYSITGLFLNSLLLIIWIKFFNLSELIAPILNLIISVPINFLLNKFWAFK
ncbi:GtrA family protein [Streptococcus sp. S784/96/1]|uniref:GtrA family protein n=1 Tax=Streptococcus sp. S784/96/1 TaxID=2653499 RepID=UPI001389A91F|nr:GtrA family protein [Streptococcus sp. S784/96/1]